MSKKYFYLFENPILYPEEYYNMKDNITDDEYIQNLMEIRQKNIEFVKNENGILSIMKVNNKQYAIRFYKLLFLFFMEFNLQNIFYKDNKMNLNFNFFIYFRILDYLI